MDSWLLGIQAESQLSIFPCMPPPLAAKPSHFLPSVLGVSGGAPLLSGLLITAYGHWEEAGLCAPGTWVAIPWGPSEFSLCAEGLCSGLPWAAHRLGPSTNGGTGK